MRTFISHVIAFALVLMLSAPQSLKYSVSTATHLVHIILFPVPPGFCGTFFCFLQPKRTDFAAALLKICGEICDISYCFAVKTYHGQHSSNIVIMFLTLRTIVGLQANI